LQVVKLVGPDVLPPSQRLILEVCTIFKNGFLQQVSFDKIDTFASARKQFLMLKIIILFYRRGEELVKKGVSVAEIRELPIYSEITRMKQVFSESQLGQLEDFSKKIESVLSELDI
jgi:V/A-type H+-transporting ATPase subunit A